MHAADELATLRFEVDVLNRRMRASIEQRDPGEIILIGVLKTMISDRQLRIRQLEQPPAA